MCSAQAHVSFTPESDIKCDIMECPLLALSGRITRVEEIAVRESCTIRQVNMTISLAFLAPNLAQAAVDERLPRGIGIANLRDAPIEWSLQHARLGLAS